MKTSYVTISVFLFAVIQAKKADVFPGEIWHTGFLQASDPSKYLHYYFFECKNASIIEAPLLVWFSGGPGFSSIFGIYEHGGPYIVNNLTGKIEKNPWAWNNIANVLYVDQPAGTLFSIANDYEKMCTDMECAGADFLAFLLNFYHKFPQYKLRDLYIAGSSYGGHFVPSLSAHLLKQGKTSIPLKGFLTFNGYFEYYTQAHGNTLFLKENKLISNLTFYVIEAVIETCRILERYNVPVLPLFCAQSDMLAFLILGLPNDPYDINIISQEDLYKKTVTELLNKDEVQEAFEVNQYFSPFNGTAFAKLLRDHLTSSVPDVGFALNRDVKVNLVFGDADYICSWIGGEAMSKEILWFGQKEFCQQPYESRYLHGIPRGETRKYKNLQFTRVYNAGHSIFNRQREFGLEILREFLYSN